MMRLASAAVVSTVLTLPLLVLQLLNGGDDGGDFPTALFAALWVLPFSFMLLAGRLAVVGGPSPWRRHSRRFVTAACLLCIASLWVAIVLDQIPCFLGVPNCD